MNYWRRPDASPTKRDLMALVIGALAQVTGAFWRSR
jgi:hypothetical protein